MVVLVLAVALPGCGGAEQGAEDAPVAATIVERDFKVGAPDRLPAGLVTLRVENRGPVDHELLIARGTLADLPLRTDGITADEDAVQTAATVEPQPAGSAEEFEARLAPGRYILFCNMAGHLGAGMHAEVVAR